MSFERVRQAKVSDAVAHQLEKMILEGVLRPGERLPAERDLAKRLDVSRPSLREAIQKLETRGLVQTRQGGGSFVANVTGAVFADPAAHLFANHPQAAFDFVEYRHGVEGMSAYYAALRATEADREIIHGRFAAMLAAHETDDPTDEANADAEFHLAIAEAAHNVVLLHSMRGLFNLYRNGVFFNRNRLYLRRGARDVLLRQHRALHDAIMEGDPEGARRAAQIHISYIIESLRELEREGQREETAQRRLARYRTETDGRGRRRPRGAEPA